MINLVHLHGELVLDKLPLEIREWRCPSCSNLNLRDENAGVVLAVVIST